MKLEYLIIKIILKNLFYLNLLGIPKNNDNLKGVHLKRPDFELL